MPDTPERLELAQYLGEELDELKIDTGGVWLVFTERSVHLFDLDDGVSVRIPGDGAGATLNDTPRKIRSIDSCRVGQEGKWTMHPYEWQLDVEFVWHISTDIVRIVRFLYPRPAVHP